MLAFKRLYDGFDSISDEYSNAFELNGNTAREDFSMKYLVGDDERTLAMRDAFNKALDKERFNAFKVGFYGAIELITNR